MIRYLAHLHNQAENVGVIVKHNTTTDISVKLPSGIGHDARRKVALNLAEELIVQNDSVQKVKCQLCSLYMMQSHQRHTASVEVP